MDERFHLGVVIEFSRISLQKTSLTLIHSLIFFCFSAVEKTRSSKKFKSQKLFHLVHTISSIYWEEKKTRSIRRYLCSILWITMRKRKETREGERERGKNSFCFSVGYSASFVGKRSFDVLWHTSYVSLMLKSYDEVTLRWSRRRFCWLRGNEKCVEQSATNLYRSHINKSQACVLLNRHKSLTASYPTLDRLWCAQDKKFSILHLSNCDVYIFKKQKIRSFISASYQERDETERLAWRREIEEKQYEHRTWINKI